MQYLALPAREWRDRLQELLDTAMEKGTILVYLRRRQPILFVIPMPLLSLPEQYSNYRRLLVMFARVIQQPRREPEINETLPTMPTNGLRRDVSRSITKLQQAGVPMLLTRYDQVIGFVVPVPTGSGGMSMIRQLSIWFHSMDEV